MTASPVSTKAGRKLLAMMDLRFDGQGKFQVSREYVTVPHDRGDTIAGTSAGSHSEVSRRSRSSVCRPADSVVVVGAVRLRRLHDARRRLGRQIRQQHGVDGLHLLDDTENAQDPRLGGPGGGYSSEPLAPCRAA
jgi:hypothetical protein